MKNKMVMKNIYYDVKITNMHNAGYSHLKTDGKRI